MDIKEYIKLNEGLRLKPYRCSAGKLTIGYGRNLEDVGISKTEAEYFLAGDIGRSYEALVDIFGQHLFSILTYNRKMVLVDMIFNLGRKGFLRFKKMIRAIKENDFDEAEIQLLNSRYATQLPSRSKRNARMMKEG